MDWKWPPTLWHFSKRSSDLVAGSLPQCSTSVPLYRQVYPVSREFILQIKSKQSVDYASKNNCEKKYFIFGIHNSFFCYQVCILLLIPYIGCIWNWAGYVKSIVKVLWPFWRWNFLPIFPFKTHLAKMLLWKTSCSVKINQFLATAIIW